MKALAVSHNGQKVAVIGVMQDSCVMAQVAGMMMAELRQTDANFDLQLSRMMAGEESYRPEVWPLPKLTVGDEITIRIVEVESDDPPPKHVPNRPKRPPQ